MSPESIFSSNDGHDTVVGLEQRIREREKAVYQAPTWEDVVRASARNAYNDLYGVLLEPDCDLYEYTEFSHTVENIVRKNCLECMGKIVPSRSGSEDAFQFNRKFSEWREIALDTISPEDDSPQLTESLLYGMDIDTLAAFANWTVGKIDSMLVKNALDQHVRNFWSDQRGIWNFRKEFIETSRRMAMDLSFPTL